MYWYIADLLCKTYYFCSGYWSLCVFMLVMVQTTHLTSSWNLATLTLNKYFSVTNPCKCQQLFGWKRSLCGASLIWILSLSVVSAFYVESEPGKQMPRTRTLIIINHKCKLHHLQMRAVYFLNLHFLIFRFEIFLSFSGLTLLMFTSLSDMHLGSKKGVPCWFPDLI